MAENAVDSSMLDGFQGAAVVVDRDNNVTQSNVKGQAIKQLMARGSLPALESSLGEVRQSSAITVSAVEVESSNGKLKFEATLIPQGGGDGGSVMVLLRDTTVEHNLRSALIESRQCYKDLVEVNSDFTWEVRADGTFVFVSPRGALGFTAKEIVGTEASDLISDKDSRAPVPFIS